MGMLNDLWPLFMLILLVYAISAEMCQRKAERETNRLRDELAATKRDSVEVLRGLDLAIRRVTDGRAAIYRGESRMFPEHDPPPVLEAPLPEWPEELDT